MNNCMKCGDKITGHEDENETHCRWCVTCIDDSGENAQSNTKE